MKSFKLIAKHKEKCKILKTILIWVNGHIRSKGPKSVKQNQKKKNILMCFHTFSLPRIFLMVGSCRASNSASIGIGKIFLGAFFDG